MRQLEIKNDVLIIDDGQNCWNAELGAIDIVCTDGYVINLKFCNGKQAFLHPDYPDTRDEFNKLVEMLTSYNNFYQCDGYVVINLENLDEISIDETKTHWGYYNLDMIFGQMKGGIASKNLEGLKQTKEEILNVKQNYDNIMMNTMGE